MLIGQGPRAPLMSAFTKHSTDLILATDFLQVTALLPCRSLPFGRAIYTIQYGSHSYIHGRHLMQVLAGAK